LDGGTELSIKTRSSRWNLELQQLACCPGPLPSLVSLGLADGANVVAAVRRHKNGGISLIFEGEAQLDVYHWNGHVNLTVKAEALWREGMEQWLATWLPRVTRWVLGEDCPSATQASAFGWRVSKVELAADFTGLHFFDGDQGLFTGKGRKRRIDSEGFKENGEIETLEIGTRGSNRLMLATHDKSQAIRNRLGCEPDASFYAPTWIKNAWDGVAVVRRVEVRASGRALLIRSRDGELLDLREPSALLDRRLHHAFWRYATKAVRLVQRSAASKGASRKRHAKQDPRWVAVQNAAHEDEGYYFRQRQAPTRRLATEQLVQRTSRKVSLGIAPLASWLGHPHDVIERKVHEFMRILLDIQPSASSLEGP